MKARIFVLGLLATLLLVRGVYAANGDAQKQNVSQAIPGAVFMEWHQEMKGLVFDIEMPWGENGAYVFLTKDGVQSASSTLRARTPLAQRKQVVLAMPDDGLYDFVAYICQDTSMKTCSKSEISTVLVRNEKAQSELSLPVDERSIARDNELNARLHSRELERTRVLFERYRGIQITPSSGKILPENVMRIKRIFDTSSMSSVLTSIDGVRLEDFYSIASQYPAFCGESMDGEPLLRACARDLSAYFSILLRYTNEDPKNEFVGMKNPVGIAALLRKDPTELLQSKDMSKEILGYTMDWYMTPKSPEPEPHRVLLDLFVPNEKDRVGGYAPGIGAVTNIASHGAWCSGAGLNNMSTVATLYQKILGRAGYADEHGTDCAGQVAFGVESAAYFPQYWRMEEERSRCVLDVLETPYDVRSDTARAACDYAAIGTSTQVTVRPIDIQDGLARANNIRSRTLGGASILLLDGKADPRAGLGTQIIASYPYWRAYDLDAQPAKIPFKEINTLLFEGARVGGSGKLEYIDTYAAVDMPFVGDCMRADCPRGILHQFAIAKNIYPDLQIVLGVSLENISAFSKPEARAMLAASIEDFLRKNTNVSGLQFDLSSSREKYDGDLLRHAIVDVRSALSSLGAEVGRNYSISLGVPAQIDLLKQVPFQSLSSTVDHVYLRAYDNHSPLELKVGHNAQIFSLDAKSDKEGMAPALLYLKEQNVPAKIVVVGVPFFGRMWSNVAVGTSKELPGLFSTHSTKADETYIDYKTIAMYLLGRGNFEHYEDKLRGAAYLFDGQTFVSYDTPEIIEQKMGFIWRDGYGGILLGDVMGDTGALQDKVMRTIAKASQLQVCKLSRKPNKDLSVGSRGGDVYALQEYLRCLGFIPSYIDIAGYFGETTKNALLKFQEDKGILRTGVVDEQTRKIL